MEYKLYKTFKQFGDASLRPLVREALEAQCISTTDEIINRVADRIHYKINNYGEMRLSTLQGIAVQAYHDL